MNHFIVSLIVVYQLILIDIDKVNFEQSHSLEFEVLGINLDSSFSVKVST